MALTLLGATCKGTAQQETVAASKAAITAEAEKIAKAPSYSNIDSIDITQVPPSRRQDFLRILNETFCYCGCPRTLAACLTSKADCSCVQCSERMTKFILNHFAAGMATEEVELTILQGFSEGYNGLERTFDLTDHPTKGSDKPKFQIVEFADFRCGHCREAHPLLKQLAAQNDVQLSYFYFPLGSDDSPSVLAAQAAEEARIQGKFWEMADLLYENHENIDIPSILGFAKKLGLDVNKFQRALDQQTHKPRVLADKKLGQKIGVQSTPSIFINGRLFGFPRAPEYFVEYLMMEAERGVCR
jgi:hypothetical protein